MRKIKIVENIKISIQANNYSDVDEKLDKIAEKILCLMDENERLKKENHELRESNQQLLAAKRLSKPVAPDLNDLFGGIFNKG